MNPCPHCGNPMGDGDRVTYGQCGPCRFGRRRYTTTNGEQGR